MTELTGEPEKVDFDKILISEVALRPYLFNKSIKEFRNKAKKQNGWDDISKLTHHSILDCQTRWKTVRDRYVKEQKAKKNGEVLNKKKKWRLYPLLRFLDNFAGPLQCSDTAIDAIEETVIDAIEESTVLEPSVATSSNASVTGEEELEAQIPVNSAITKRKHSEGVRSLSYDFPTCDRNQFVLDECMSFGISVGHALKQLPKEKLQLAKLKIQDVLVHMENSHFKR